MDTRDGNEESNYVVIYIYFYTNPIYGSTYNLLYISGYLIVSTPRCIPLRLAGCWKACKCSFFTWYMSKARFMNSVMIIKWYSTTKTPAYNIYLRVTRIKYNVFVTAISACIIPQYTSNSFVRYCVSRCKINGKQAPYLIEACMWLTMNVRRLIIS